MIDVWFGCKVNYYVNLVCGKNFVNGSGILDIILDKVVVGVRS